MTRKSINTAVRIPPDLLGALDAACAKRPGATRSSVIVAALRAYLKVKAPAEMIGDEEPKP